MLLTSQCGAGMNKRQCSSVVVFISGFLWIVVAVCASDPMVTLSVNELTFGTQAQGTSSTPQIVLLGNTGQADLTINSIALSGENSSDFVETTTCPAGPAVLAAGRSCEIRVVFHPRTSVTDLAATLNISDNAAGSPRTVALRGTPTPAVSGITLTPASITFGSQTVGASSSARIVLLTNSGSATLNVNSAISISGADANEFKLQKSANACPEASGQIAPRASCEIVVVFAPTNAGGKSAQVVIMDDAAGGPHVITLSGAAVGP
jgi:hypothetical protein